ncbi:MAG TPA: ATP-binding protein [Sphaerochaetaceae bacterium]|nr:ATP-binding protein [Sphaerochaetaceae bacterium]
MRFSGIRERLIALTATVLLLALLGGMFVAIQAFNTTLRETTYAALAENSRYLLTLLSQHPEQLQTKPIDDELLQQLDRYGETTMYRITLIDDRGTVVYDSAYHEPDLDNHLWREEVQQALSFGVGQSERTSDTQQLPVLYHAVHLGNDSGISILRVSTTLHELAGFQQTYLRILLSGLIILAMVTSVVTAVSIGTISRPLKRIKEATVRYAAGELNTRIHVERPRELAELAATMQSMATRLSDTLDHAQNERNRLETILESMNEGIILVNDRMEIVVANRGARAILGEALRLRAQTTLSQAIRSKEINEICSHTLDTGETQSVTTAQYGHIFGESARIVGRTAATILRVTTVPVREQGDTAGVVITINDTTELHRLEQMRKDFVANVSHELKTPITAIAGFSNLLSEEANTSSDEIARFSAIIARQAETMQRIVEDLLLLSSLEQHHAKPSCTWTSVEQIVEETVETCRFKAEQQGSSIITRVKNRENLALWVNGKLIVQALANLVINAITYSEPGSDVTLDIAVTESTATLQVIDTGFGIPPEAQQRIFERFYRVDTARSRRLGGTGLGLSIVKHIVGVHSGVVSVTSELGKGSVFTITLPRGARELDAMQRKSDTLYEQK